VRLEEYGLIRVDRSSANYTAWIMLAPKSSWRRYLYLILFAIRK
jgi:hypothetical protein